MKDEIKIIKDATVIDMVESYRKTSMLKNPKLVRIALTFRDGNDGITETRAMNHKTYEHED